MSSFVCVLMCGCGWYVLARRKGDTSHQKAKNITNDEKQRDKREEGKQGKKQRAPKYDYIKKKSPLLLISFPLGPSGF